MASPPGGAANAEPHYDGMSRDLRSLQRACKVRDLEFERLASVAVVFPQYRCQYQEQREQTHQIDPRAGFIRPGEKKQRDPVQSLDQEIRSERQKKRIPRALPELQEKHPGCERGHHHHTKQKCLKRSHRLSQINPYSSIPIDIAVM